MAAIDTNVLVRYLVEDDALQSAAARTLVEAAVRDRHPLFVPVTVMLELQWVLKSRLGCDKGTALEVLTGLLSADELVFESEQAIEVALEFYHRESADCLHVALAARAGECPLWTFDRKASRVPGAGLIEVQR